MGIPTDAYCDGGVVARNPSAIGGTWAYALVDADGVLVGEGSGIVHPAPPEMPLVTNNVTEFLAVTAALEALPSGWSGRVNTDSQVTIRRFAKVKAAETVTPYWPVDAVPQAIVERAWEAMRDLGDVRFVLLSGHPTKADLERGATEQGRPVSPWNVYVDEACGRAKMEFFPTIPLEA